MEDRAKDYNENLKAIESLVKREGELLQKLSQSDHTDIERKKQWAKELSELIEAVARLEAKRIALLPKL